MKIMSIDASSHSTGVAIIEDNKVLFHTCITSQAINPYTRIKKMVSEIEKIYLEYKPTDIIMEDILPSDVRNNQNTFKILHYLQAAVVLMMDDHKGAPPVNLYVASHWRKLIGVKTGRGVKRETLKKEVMNYIEENYGIVANDDVCDAIGIGMAYLKENDSFDWS